MKRAISQRRLTKDERQKIKERGKRRRATTYCNLLQTHEGINDVNSISLRNRRQREAEKERS